MGVFLVLGSVYRPSVGDPIDPWLVYRISADPYARIAAVSVRILGGTGR
jgi:hypothetical protein